MTSAERLRERLAAHSLAMCLYQSEALYHAQVDWTCLLLDVVDEVADPVIAAKIADLICDRLTGKDVSDPAWNRLSAFEAEFKRLMG